MEADNQGAFHIQKIRQHPVVQFRRENLHKADRAVLFPHAELPAGAELKGSGGDEVLGGKAGGGQPVPRKGKGNLFVHVEYAMQLGQPRPPVQRLRHYAQPLEVVEQVGFNPFQPGLCRPDAVRVNAEGQVFCLNQAVVPLCQLVLQHLGVLAADVVKIIPLGRDGDGPGKGFLGRGQVEEGQLEPDGAVKVVEEIAPALEDGGLILVLGQLVIDVLKLNGLGIVAAGHAADAVRPHPFIGDAVLRGNPLLVSAAGAGNGGFDLLPIRAGELLFHRHWPFALRRSAVCPVFLCRKQCHTPPCRVCPAAPIRHRSCWSGRGAAGAGERIPGSCCR